MRRLYAQIYLALLAVILLFLLLAGIAWRFVPPDADRAESMQGVNALLSRWLPRADAPAAQQQEALEQLARWFNVELTLRSSNGELVAAVGRAAPFPQRPSAATQESSVENDMRAPEFREHGPSKTLQLADGRWLSARWQHGRWPKRLLGALALLAAAVAIASYPIARRIARRLERLQTQVDAFGEGNLSARVDVRGNDEIAQLARTFNRSAEQIEKLLAAQRSTLAAASHELRSPLARIRMAVELLGADARADVRERVNKDITELDDLVGELLLASRLEALQRIERNDEVDLLGLLAEECARSGAEVSGERVQVMGDARMLRRMVRNLLENARRYGGGAVVEASARPLPGGGAAIVIADRGPGIPEAERERIFAPFYRLAGTPESGEGAGLGLSLVRQIARHHGGDVCCLPRAGGGSEFQVTLN